MYKRTYSNKSGNALHLKFHELLTSILWIRQSLLHSNAVQ
jgi:hypothetical protein